MRCTQREILSEITLHCSRDGRHASSWGRPGLPRRRTGSACGPRPPTILHGLSFPSPPPLFDPSTSDMFSVGIVLFALACGYSTDDLQRVLDKSPCVMARTRAKELSYTVRSRIRARPPVASGGSGASVSTGGWADPEVLADVVIELLSSEPKRRPMPSVLLRRLFRPC